MMNQVSVYRMIENLKRNCSQDKFANYINTLLRIFRNIRTNLIQEQYRTLKKTNQKIAQLISVNEVAQILSYGGFENSKDVIIMNNISIGRIDDVLQSLSKFDDTNKFDPFKSQITNLSGNKQIQGESSVVFNDKLEQLEKERERIMSKPIHNRDVKIYRLEGKQIKADSSWNDERQLNITEKQFADSIKQKLRSFGENPQFMNRRKQEYFDLMKKPCFSQTLVRVKLPDHWYFECKFSPLEKLEELTKIFHEYVENKNLNYYLYMTPPVEKLSGKVLRQTFYERDCVPTALFYFGSEEKVSGNILRQKKSGGFLNSFFK